MNSHTHQILVVDDETLSRHLLSGMLQSASSRVEIHEAKNGEDALTHVFSHRIDIAFLDIDMPGLNGLVLAENLLKLVDPPIIVFATGAARHAVRGFELQVVDYVLKPFLQKRVTEALTRAIRALSAASAKKTHLEGIQQIVNHSLADVDKLWAERVNGARMLVDFESIGWAQAREKEVFVRTATEELKIRLTLNALQERLSSPPFVRVHRTWLVNINLVREVIPWDSHSMTLIMGDKGKTEIPVSRTYTGALKHISGW